MLPVGSTVKVPLSAIADVDEAEVQSRITRIDEAPSATISAVITSGDTGATSIAVQAAIDELEADGTIPPSAEVEIGGVLAQQAEAFSGLFAAMGIAILLVYLMMVLAFNSLVTPFIILFSLPLATIGAFPALLITDRPIGLSALIGFLMLIGIVVTNAIVLLDLVERLRAEGYSTYEALIRGGHTRLRPILMTAIATILALVPLAAGFNEGSIIAAELGHGRDRRADQLDDADAAGHPGDLRPGRQPQAADRRPASRTRHPRPRRPPASRRGQRRAPSDRSPSNRGRPAAQSGMAPSDARSRAFGERSVGRGRRLRREGVGDGLVVGHRPADGADALELVLVRAPAECRVSIRS